jgi:hypothetical protein
MRQMNWFGHIMGEKIAGLILLSITAFLASKTHHPSGKWGVVTGIAAAVTFQLIAALVYVLQFGVALYRQNNAFFYTMWWTVLLAWGFGYLAVRKQCLSEKRTA